MCSSINLMKAPRPAPKMYIHTDVKKRKHLGFTAATIRSSSSLMCFMCLQHESLEGVEEELSRVAPTLQRYAQFTSKPSVSFAQDSPATPLSAQAFLSQLECTEDGEVKVIRKSEAEWNQLGEIMFTFTSTHLLTHTVLYVQIWVHGVLVKENKSLLFHSNVIYINCFQCYELHRSRLKTPLCVLCRKLYVLGLFML